MTEQTLEEQASQAFARAFACVFPLPLTVRSEQTDAAVAFIADFARAHAERETEALRETLSQYERDFARVAELERKRIVEIVDLQELVRKETERADVAEQSEAELTQACKDLDAQIVDLRAELATVTKERDTVLFDARTKNVVEVAEFAALRARLARIEAAAKPIVQHIEYVDDPKTTLEAAQRAWSPYWREFRALRDAIAAEPTTHTEVR